MLLQLLLIGCHKSWLSKADFTWLIVISHKLCLHFTLCSQLTHSSHMTRTCASSLYYNWLILLWLTIVSYNDVMTFARDWHLSHEFHSGGALYAPDLFDVLWLVYGMLRSDLLESSDRFRAWLVMSHRTMWLELWVTRVRVVGLKSL